MPICPQCSAVLSQTERDKCNACGSGISWEFGRPRQADDPNQSQTPTKEIEEDHTPTQLKHTGSRDPIDTGNSESEQFVAGTILNKRYRIISLLGKGGMGEVYKAEDLELNGTVALKFLPTKLAANKDLLSRFRGEVRIARQVSHENVCRVFDIGEIGGRRFLSMEYIEGDDLAQLLDRIGRLPSDKAVEISRQICLGLNAIHKLGILHRDLKPANIIIDSKGKARITDFGIAGFEGSVHEDEIRVGTLAYMSPEQISGNEVSKRSDIFSLGLVLYEIFTGRQAIEADSVDEFAKKHQTTSPVNPTELVEGIDPLVEKIINRCLEKNPEDRPESAIAVALALPGGNPLEVVLEAGETPSPEVVAAAPAKGALSPRRAIAALIAVVLLFTGIVGIYQTSRIRNLVPLRKSPEILAEKSREILSSFGYRRGQFAENYSFFRDSAFTDSYRFFDKHPEGLPSRRNMISKGQPAAVYFLYRQGPEHIIPRGSVMMGEDNPPLNVSEMANVKLDTRGRLLEFVVFPPQSESKSKNTEVDWERVFSFAELDFENFQETRSEWAPPVYADERRAWSGTLTDFPQIPIRVEAASHNGRPVYFRIVAPWDTPPGESVSGSRTFRSYGLALVLAVSALVILGSVFLVYRHQKRGVIDLRGGLKLTLFVFFVAFASQMLFASHVSSILAEFTVIYTATGFAAIRAVFIGLMFIAIEPFVRRSWSDSLISWNRLLVGDFRDPMVGRDVLIGGLLGLVHLFGVQIGQFLLQLSVNKFDALFGGASRSMSSLKGMLQSTGWYLDSLVNAIGIGLLLVFITFFFSAITGSRKSGILVAAIFALIVQILVFLLGFPHWAMFITPLISVACLVLAIWRFGLVGTISFIFVIGIFQLPFTFDTNHFYFPVSTLMIAVSLGLMTYAAYISIAKQPLLGGTVLPDGD